MNKINVSELSDTELNRAMIWLYPPADSVIYSGAINMYMARYRVMNYLNSWDLLMPLAIENGIDISCISKRVSYGMNILDNYTSAKNENLLRAICEVLVMIKLSEHAK